MSSGQWPAEYQQEPLGHESLRDFRLHYDVDYGIDKRSGWSVIVNGIVRCVFVSLDDAMECLKACLPKDHELQSWVKVPEVALTTFPASGWITYPLETLTDPTAPPPPSPSNARLFSLGQFTFPADTPGGGSISFYRSGWLEHKVEELDATTVQDTVLCRQLESLVGQVGPDLDNMVGRVGSFHCELLEGPCQVRISPFGHFTSVGPFKMARAGELPPGLAKTFIPDAGDHPTGGMPVPSVKDIARMMDKFNKHWQGPGDGMDEPLVVG